jgi:signal transduction histidine kinase
VGTRVRQAVPIDTASVTVLQQTHDDHRVAIVVSSRKLEEWLTTAARGLPGEPTIALLSNADQRSRDEADTGANASWIAPASETGLLWTIRLDYRSSISTAVEPVRRTPLLAIGLAAIVTLLGGGGYMLWRVMRREIVVNRLQTEFVSAVSHEFRTPLTSLRHATELLNESDAISRDRRDSLYRAMDQDTRRLQRLVESLLDFSRMEAGRKAYHLRPQRIDALTHDVVDEFRDALRERDVSVAVTVADDARIAIQADAVALSNAIWNLLENAVKYSPDRPVIEVAVRRVSTGVAIAVRDYGLGIPAHEQPHVFERFMRGTRAIALGIKGTGLGLALVSHVVSAHGGRVSVDSVEGQGSTFTIWLPGAGDAARVTSQPAPGVSRSEPARQRVPDL